MSWYTKMFELFENRVKAKTTMVKWISVIKEELDDRKHLDIKFLIEKFARGQSTRRPEQFG